MSNAVELLADELKRLVGHGAHPKRLPLLPTLRGLVEIDDAASVVATGYVIRRHLVQSINCISASELLERRLTADQLNRALKYELRLEGAVLYVEPRRERAIKVLGFTGFYTTDQWRRKYGPEYELLLLLAEHLVALSKPRQLAA